MLTTISDLHTEDTQSVFLHNTENHLSFLHVWQGYTSTCRFINSLSGRRTKQICCKHLLPNHCGGVLFSLTLMKPRRHHTIALHLIPEPTDLMFRRLCQGRFVLAASLCRWLWVMPTDMSCCHRDDSLSITIRNITASLPKRQSAEEWPSSHHHSGCSSPVTFVWLDF